VNNSPSPPSGNAPTARPATHDLQLDLFPPAQRRPQGPVRGKIIFFPRKNKAATDSTDPIPFNDEIGF
jgi:hypothetical protein